MSPWACHTMEYVGLKNSQRILNKTNKQSNPTANPEFQHGTRLVRGKPGPPGTSFTPPPSPWTRQFSFTTFKKLPIRSGFNFKFIAFSKATSFGLHIYTYNPEDSRGHTANVTTNTNEYRADKTCNVHT